MMLNACGFLDGEQAARAVDEDSAGFLAELLLASTTTSHPASAGASPSPVARSTRYSGAWRLSTLILCPRASSSATTCRPSVPVPPTMATVMVPMLP